MHTRHMHTLLSVSHSSLAQRIRRLRQSFRCVVRGLRVRRHVCRWALRTVGVPKSSSPLPFFAACCTATVVAVVQHSGAGRGPGRRETATVIATSTALPSTSSLVTRSARAPTGGRRSAQSRATTGGCGFQPRAASSGGAATRRPTAALSCQRCVAPPVA